MAAELFLQIAVSLDGYIEDADKNIEWMEFDTSFDHVVTETLRAIDGMIFGRKAHVLLNQFWPTAGQAEGASPDLIEQARLMNALPKYVLTHGPETTGWSNSHAIRLADIARLKREARRPLALFAGASAAHAALGAGLIDEIRLIQAPVLLGGGTPLFSEDAKRRTLRLINSKHFVSGALLSCYRVEQA